MKQLLPALRERNRYVVFEFISDFKFEREDVTKAVWGSALEFLGDLGLSRISLKIIEWDTDRQRGVLKVNHKSTENIRAALALIKEINKIQVIFHVLGISGTLKTAREKFFNR